MSVAKGKFYIFPVSDLHLGHEKFNNEFFKFWDKTFRETSKNKCIYLLGDLIDNPSSRMGAFDSSMSTEDSVQQVIDLFRPHKKYVRFCATGNHERRTKKDFNLDVTKIIAERLGAKYTSNDFFDKLEINGKELIVYGKHGTRFSKSPQLAMRGFIQDMSSIHADLCMMGHNHFSEFSSKYIRDYNGGKRRYYCFTGHFLNYENSYAHNQGKDMSLCGFQRLEVTNNCSINSKNYYLDEVR